MTKCFNQRIVPQDGTIYAEFAYEGSVIVMDPEDPKSGILTIVRCGPGEVNEQGVERPMRYTEGQRVIITPRSAIRMPRGYLFHQNNVLAVIEDHEGEDEMKSRSISALAGTKALFAAASSRPIDA